MSTHLEYYVQYCAQYQDNLQTQCAYVDHEGYEKFKEKTKTVEKNIKGTVSRMMTKKRIDKFKDECFDAINMSKQNYYLIDIGNKLTEKSTDELDNSQ